MSDITSVYLIVHLDAKVDIKCFKKPSMRGHITRYICKFSLFSGILLNSTVWFLSPAILLFFYYLWKKLRETMKLGLYCAIYEYFV